MDYRSYRHRRRESMRSSMKTPLMPDIREWARTMAYISITWDGLLPELSEPSFEAASPSSLFTVSMSGTEKIFNSCTVSCTTCTTTREGGAFPWVYTRYLSPACSTQAAAGYFVLYFIWSPRSLIRLIRLLLFSIICFAHSLVVPSWYVILLEGRKLRMTFTVGMSLPHGQTWD